MAPVRKVPPEGIRSSSPGAGLQNMTSMSTCLREAGYSAARVAWLRPELLMAS